MINLYKISIIIPIYNVEEYITECLQSVMRQTYRGNIECILVDDSGSDNSIAVAEQLIADYKGSISFHILHHERNRGLSAARNTGTDLATGDYIYYLDSDDYISDDCIDQMVDPLQKREYDMVIGNYETFGDYRVQSLLFEQQSELIGNEQIFHEFAERQLCVTAWNKLCRKSFLKNHTIDFFEGQFHEDDLWTYKIIQNASSLAIQKTCTYYYRQRKNSIVYDPKIKANQRFESLYVTVDYILHHRGQSAEEDYTKCALTYIGKCLSYAIEGDFDFYKEYCQMRNCFLYKPVVSFLHGKISAKELKRTIHFAFPKKFGYWYLLLRRTKLNLKQDRV